MLGKKLLEQCGTIEVRVAPLMAMIGALMTLDTAADFEDLLNLLNPEAAVSF